LNEIKAIIFTFTRTVIYMNPRPKVFVIATVML